MIIAEQLETIHSKANTVMLQQYIGNDETRLEELMCLFFGDNDKLSQRAAWVVRHVFDETPYMIAPYYERMISQLHKPNLPDAVLRNSLSILSLSDLSEKQSGDVLDVSFNFLTSDQQPVAIKVFAMTVVFNALKFFPEIAKELKITIEDQLPYSSAGFRSRGSKILTAIEKGKLKY